MEAGVECWVAVLRPTASKITALCRHRIAQPWLLDFCPQLEHVILAFENDVWIILCGLQNYFRRCLLNPSFNFECLLFSSPAHCSQRQCIPLLRLGVRVGSSFSGSLCCFCLSRVTLQFILLSICLVFLGCSMYGWVKPEWIYVKFSEFGAASRFIAPHGINPQQKGMRSLPLSVLSHQLDSISTDTRGIFCWPVSIALLSTDRQSFFHSTDSRYNADATNDLI